MPTGRERRQMRRIHLPRPVDYQVAGEPLALSPTGLLVDLSASGLRFLCDRTLDPGTKVTCTLKLPNRPEPYELTGTVVRFERMGAGMEYGVAFVNVSPDRQAEIDSMVRFVEKKPTQRGHARS